MTVKPLHRALMRAMALGETAKARALSKELAEVDRHSYHAFVTALFCTMLEHRFKASVSRDIIAEFANELRIDYSDANPPIKPLVIEGVIRASLGEEHLLNEISADDTVTAEYQVIRKIVLQSEEATADFGMFLDKAEALVTEWEDEEA